MVMMRPVTHEGYQLLQEGVIALTRIEANGMKTDEEYLTRMIAKCEADKKVLRRQLQETKEWTLWRKRFGERAKLTAPQQLATLLYDVMGYKPTEFTDKGAPSTDESALEKIDLPFLKVLIRFQKLNKASGTFLKGIQRECVNGFIHPNFNLHIAQTFRSSSDNPNFQNMPVRDPMMAELIRSAFRSRFGKKGTIVENDYKGIEVSVSASYHKDKKFIEYIVNPLMDMHRDMSMQCFIFTPDEWKTLLDAKVQKNARYGAKNMFVFPQFYGDYYVSNAKALWEWIERGKLVLKDGRTFKEWLASKGIKKLGKCDPDEKPVKGTFEYHMKQVEDDFWNNRFKDYGKWKKKWWSQYLEDGYFDTYTGFRIAGTLDRNQAINYPVQGSAFHVLLWSLIRIQKILRKEKMKAVIAGQIHDSLIGDVPTDELTDYLSIVHEVSTNDVRKHWDWINVPLTVENEIVPTGGTWFDKKECHFENGIYTFKRDDVKVTFNKGEAEAFLDALGQKKAA